MSDQASPSDDHNPAARGILVRVVTAPFELTAAILGRLLTPRGLTLCYLLVFTWLATSHWLRPPLGDDLSGFQLPLSVFGTANANPFEIVYGPRSFYLFSPGMLIAAAAVLAAWLVIANPRWIPFAFGFTFVALMGCEASVVFNHPQVIEILEHENELHFELVDLLKTTVQPGIDVGARPRVESTSNFGVPGAFLRGLVYLPQGRLTLLLIAACAIAFTTAGSLARRLGVLAGWGAAGGLAVLILAGPRMNAEWHWNRAVRAEARGELFRAEDDVRIALDRFPALAGSPRIWTLLGKIDFQRGRKTAAARYFQASQWARNRQYAHAIDELTSLAAAEQPHPAAQRWLSEIISRYAYASFQSEQLAAAESAWERAARLEQSAPYYGLCIAIVRSRATTCDPEAVASLVDPMLPHLANSALRAALLSMIADCYFEAGNFAEARTRYLASVDAFSLPKQINYRAHRGLIGM